MSRCAVDSSLKRLVIGDFQFPLGVYPVEDMEPKPGYTMVFEPADGDGDGEFEEWPDRYVFDIVMSHQRLEPFCRQLFSLFRGRVFPILDVLGRDDFREIDPYIAYDLIGMDRFLECLRRYRDFFYEDGLCGFGVMTEEPFFYAFVDEHKIVTIRAEPHMKERIEALLRAFDLEPREDPAGADATAHEHRGVLASTDENLLTFDQIVEDLRDEWRLLLNIDPTNNVDDEGKDLGNTIWHCVARFMGDEGRRKYAEVILAATTLEEAERMAMDAAEALPKAPPPDDADLTLVAIDRVAPDRVGELQIPKGESGDPEPSRIISSRWLE